jgi:hypothetical protein
LALNPFKAVSPDGIFATLSVSGEETDSGIAGGWKQLAPDLS